MEAGSHSGQEEVQGHVRRATAVAARPADWSPECLAIEDKRRAEEADDVAIEIRQEFIRDELQHRMRALRVAVDRDGRLPLCKVRPLAGV